MSHVKFGSLCPRTLEEKILKMFAIPLSPCAGTDGDWNAKVWKDAKADCGEVCGPYCNVDTNEKGLRLSKFATFHNLVLTDTLGPLKPSRR